MYAGIDPVTGRRNDMTVSAPSEKEARRILRRLTAEVEEQRVAQTKATLGTAVDAWLKIHEVEANTLRGYESNARRYIRPALGHVSIGKITAQVLEEFYAELRRCRLRCDGRPMIEHLTDGKHECQVVRHRMPVGRPPKGGHRDHDCAKMHCEVTECLPHVCKPLAASTIRDIHFTISAALAAAVRWEWIKSNPAAVARKPRKPTPEPTPPTPEQAAKITAAAWEQDADWGTFVWLTMVTGMRRAELLGVDANYWQTSFGPTNVELHRLSAALDLGDISYVVEHSDVDATRMPVERRVVHPIDMARALTYAGRATTRRCGSCWPRSVKRRHSCGRTRARARRSRRCTDARPSPAAADL